MPETRTPGPVPKDALDYWRAKDLRVGFDHRDVWGDEHAHAFTVAKMTQLDLLQTTRDSLDAALAEGQTFREWSNAIRPEMQRRGWWGIEDRIDPRTGETRQVQLGSPHRLKTIYRSNMRSARAAGQWQRIQRTKASQPYLVYQLGPSEEHREEHVALQGLTLPVDADEWNTIYPPNGYGCKCWVEQISRATRDDYQANGVPDALAPGEIDPATGLPTGHRQTQQVPIQTRMPNLPNKRYVNKRTGEISTAPAGIHPAWANNSGAARVRVIRQALTNRIDATDRQFAKAAAADVVDSPVFDQFQQDAAAHAKALAARQPAAIDAVGELPIGVLAPDLQNALGTSGQLTRISGQTMAKQLRKHGELSAADYRAVQSMLDGGLALKTDNGQVIVFAKDGDRYRQAVIKATGKRDKAYVVSYHYATPERLRTAMKRARAKGQVIRSAEK